VVENSTYRYKEKCCHREDITLAEARETEGAMATPEA